MWVLLVLYNQLRLFKSEGSYKKPVEWYGLLLSTTSQLVLSIKITRVHEYSMSLPKRLSGSDSLQIVPDLYFALIEAALAAKSTAAWLASMFVNKRAMRLYIRECTTMADGRQLATKSLLQLETFLPQEASNNRIITAERLSWKIRWDTNSEHPVRHRDPIVLQFVRTSSYNRVHHTAVLVANNTSSGFFVGKHQLVCLCWTLVLRFGRIPGRTHHQNNATHCLDIFLPRND